MKYIMQNSKSNYNQVIDRIFYEKKDEIFYFFDSEEIDLPVTIYVYNSIEELVKGLKERGFKSDPDYMCACQKDEDNSLNFFEPKDNPSDSEWSKEEYNNVIFHELIHCIQFNLFGSTPEWINEGIAKYLDGTYSKGIKWLLDKYINNKLIPNQYEIEEEFGMHEYDSYDYAYLMVSYIIDYYGKDSLIESLRNKEKLNNIKKDLLIRSINHYNKKLEDITMDIKERFLEDFKVPKGNKKEPYIILFDAYTGQGKSYVSKIISKYDKSIILNNDEIRNWLNDYSDKSNLKNELQKYRLELLLHNGNSCIMDSCFCHHWKEKKDYYDKLGYKYYVIRLECNEKVIESRLQTRTKDNDNYSEANYNDYLWMKNNVSHVDDNLIDYTINTENDVDTQVKEFIDNNNLYTK